MLTGIPDAHLVMLTGTRTAPSSVDLLFLDFIFNRTPGPPVLVDELDAGGFECLANVGPLTAFT
jgi:hypothetical protein